MIHSLFIDYFTLFAFKPEFLIIFVYTLLIEGTLLMFHDPPQNIKVWAKTVSSYMLSNKNPIMIDLFASFFLILNLHIPISRYKSSKK